MSDALRVGTLVSDRFRVAEPIGKGGWALTYLAINEDNGSRVVLKEFFPEGARRGPDGLVRLPGDDSDSALATSAFIKEAKLVAGLRHPGIIRVLDAIKWGGTAYIVTEYLPGYRTLASLLEDEAPLPVEVSVGLLRAIGDALSAIHAAGFLHRDVKPTNILIRPDGSPVLIDFGAAREWDASKRLRHTTVFTPGYGPIEQLSQVGQWGPALDVYALAATGYEMLTGERPPSAVDRVGGATLPPVRETRPDVPSWIAGAIEHGLALYQKDRPQTVGAFLEPLEMAVAAVEMDSSFDPLERLDDTYQRLRAFSFRVNQCPTCLAIMTKPKSKPLFTCMVCRVGRVLMRKISERLCAVCRNDLLDTVDNSTVLAFCPVCGFGRLRKAGLIRKKVTCESCASQFTSRGTELKLVDSAGRTSELYSVGHTGDQIDFWKPIGGRADFVHVCGGCGAQFDEVDGDQWRLSFVPNDVFGQDLRHKAYAPWEWARIAARLPLDAGNAGCERCRSDYFVEDGAITLLDANEDPYQCVPAILGKQMSLQQAAMVAGGKPSGEAGLYCTECDTEFDFDGDYLRLSGTMNPVMRETIGSVRTLEDWHRMALGLPSVTEEPDFLNELESTIRLGLLRGEIEWDDEGDRCTWAGTFNHVQLSDEGWDRIGSGRIRLESRMLVLSAGSRSRKIPLDAISQIREMDGALQIFALGEREPIQIEVLPVEMELGLNSGNYAVSLMQGEFLEALRLAGCTVSRQ